MRSGVVMRWIGGVVLFGLLFCPPVDGNDPASRVLGAAPEVDTRRGDRMIADYFGRETARLRDDCLADVRTLDDWLARRGEYRRQLMEMLGLDPPPPKTDLKATVTGRHEFEEFSVENVQFQSRPGLYVTGNLYLPKNVASPAPTILYVCGHASVKKDGVSLGGKAHYQHHGAWFARHGYVSLVIDTLQLGEIEGIHHGTYKYDMFWWLNRGYTPAGVEAWNCVRALDYLQSRPEVDGRRIGVTGRSGGGAYSWWIAAIDDRIQCAVPVAGITDLRNYVVDGAVEGHCDCMFMVNTYRWDYPMVAALVAPRPLLISNTDRDPIFPFDGVVRTYDKVRRLYELHGKAAGERVAINITAGGHNDTQELQMHAFRWFDRHLKNETRLLEKAARPLVEQSSLRVFSELPPDQQNTRIHETFVPKAAPQSPPTDKEHWVEMQTAWRRQLVEKSFRGWPADAGPLQIKPAFDVERQGIRFRAFDFTSQPAVELRLFVAQRAGLEKSDLVVLNALDEKSWPEFLASMRPAFAEQLTDEAAAAADPRAFEEMKKMFQSFPWTMAYVAPRGVGPTAWDASPRKQIQHRRRFYLLGQTLESMQTWDLRRAVQAIRADAGLADTPLWLQSHRVLAGATLYASLFEPNIRRLDLYELPASHRDGPTYLNVERYLDMPQAVAMAAERSQLAIYTTDDSPWEYPRRVVEKLGWPAKNLQIRKPPAGPAAKEG